ncbi:MAG: hypothetical protein COV46_06270 [Deltaproteobacteria bacterium CG11_big_fil_rev_8_21_14_0_20_49_13]|nr:MAG: hypothetical protein COV46_06270 [Deltaproteobacteria bacterium CG11_big_fil_rev_8_21_14_0_20_49_13]
MKKVVLATITVLAMSWIMVPTEGFATATLMKDSGKKACTDCHTAIPKKDDADKKLNEEGKKYLKK